MTDDEIEQLAPLIASQSVEQFRLQARFDRDKAAMISRHLREREAVAKGAGPIVPYPPTLSGELARAAAARLPQNKPSPEEKGPPIGDTPPPAVQSES